MAGSHVYLNSPDVCNYARGHAMTIENLNYVNGGNKDLLDGDSKPKMIDQIV